MHIGDNKLKPNLSVLHDRELNGAYAALAAGKGCFAFFANGGVEAGVSDLPKALLVHWIDVSAGKWARR